MKPAFYTSKETAQAAAECFRGPQIVGTRAEQFKDGWLAWLIFKDGKQNVVTEALITAYTV